MDEQPEEAKSQGSNDAGDPRVFDPYFNQNPFQARSKDENFFENTAWDKFADKDDTQLRAWQRIMKVNAFMLATQSKQQLEKVLEPVLKSQEALEVDFLKSFGQKIDKLIEEFQLVKSDVYGEGGSRNDRLAQLERRIADEESARKSENIATQELV